MEVAIPTIEPQSHQVEHKIKPKQAGLKHKYRNRRMPSEVAAKLKPMISPGEEDIDKSGLQIS